MKTNKDSLRSAMDRRLSFLDELPSCRAGLYHRIAVIQDFPTEGGANA